MSDAENRGEKVHLSIEVPVEQLEDVKQVLAQFALDNSIELPMISGLESAAEARASVEKAGPFTWVENPQTGEAVVVIRPENMVHLHPGYVGQSETILKHRATRLIRALPSGIEAPYQDGEGPILIGADLKNGQPIVGIKVISALNLLRKLKNEMIGERKNDGSIGVKGFGEIGLKFFEEYCERLFPRVDISKATQELDMEKITKKLDRSAKRVEAWRWVGNRAPGETFMQINVARELKMLDLGSHFGELQVLGLVDRKPSYNEYDKKRTISEPLLYPHWPLTRMDDDRWDGLNVLLDSYDTLQPFLED